VRERTCVACGASTRGAFVMCLSCGALVNPHRLLIVAVVALACLTALMWVAWGIRDSGH
jgi:hypothetical protein